MAVTLGINGFGRMGRLGLRAGWGREGLDFVQVNEIATDAAGAAHLLQFDSVHGTWGQDCAADADALRVGARRIAYSRNAGIAETDWSGCDLVIEATGKHHKQPGALRAYFEQGVKKVIVAAPTDGALNLVYGINDQLYDRETVFGLMPRRSAISGLLSPSASSASTSCSRSVNPSSARTPRPEPSEVR